MCHSNFSNRVTIFVLIPGFIDWSLTAEAQTPGALGLKYCVIQISVVKKVKPKATMKINNRAVSIVQLSKVKQATKKKTATPDKSKNKEASNSKPHVNKAYIEIVKTGELCLN